LSVALIVRIKPRAEKQIEAAAAWWSENRPEARGAVRSDLKAALDALVKQPGIGALVENSRDPETRRLYLARTRYFLYYRPRGRFLDVVAFWHSSREHAPKV
jgi:plasmid stabilization system protein ParE